MRYMAAFEDDTESQKNVHRTDGGDVARCGWYGSKVQGWYPRV